MQQFSFTVCNIGIITSHPSEVIEGLSSLLQTGAPRKSQPSEVDLVIHKKDRAITKYWIIKKQNENDYNRLTKTYIDHCCVLYMMDEPLLVSMNKVDWVRQKIPLTF